MKRIQKYSNFQSLNEKVYLANTIFKKYNLLVDPYSGIGHFNLDLKGGYHDIEMEVQSYGKPEDKQLIMRMPSKLSHLPERMSIFESIIKDILYILNKNQFDYKFTLNRIDKERGPLGEYAIINLDRTMKIEDLERIAQMTKIVNPKVKDMKDFDKLIYKSNESDFFILNEGRSEKLDFNGSVEDAIAKYAPWYDIEKAMPIYRGKIDYSETKYYSVNPKEHSRKSANTSNYYTLIVDNENAWRNYPKRSQSIICSTSAKKAEAYGEGDHYLVIPFKENSKFGKCPKHDMFYSFPKLLEIAKERNWKSSGNEIFSMGQFNRVLRGFFNYQEVYPHSYDKLEEAVNLINENWRDIITRMEKVHNRNISPLTKPITWEEMVMSMSPEVNGFSTFEYNNQTKLKTEGEELFGNGFEVWTDAPCLLISKRAFKIDADKWKRRWDDLDLDILSHFETKR